MQDNKQLLADAEFYIQKHTLPESTNEGFQLIDRFIDALREYEQRLYVAVEALEYATSKIEKAGDRGLTQVNKHGHIFEALEIALNAISGKD